MMTLRTSERSGHVRPGRLSGLLLGSLLLATAALSPRMAQAQGGTGLLGQYYDWSTTEPCPPDPTHVFTAQNLTWTRIDPTINFGNPFTLPNTTATNFAAQWSGYIEVPTTGDYQFTTRSDDGVRLWVSDNPSQVPNPATDTPGIDQWVARGEGADDQPISVTMTAGQKYPVLIQFFQCGGGSAVRLRYTPPGATTSSIVPQSMLFPAATTDTTPPAAITDLKASNPTPHTVDLTWTAPGDNGTTGTALGYQVFYSPSAISPATLSTTPVFAGTLHPKAAGSPETLTVTGLDPLQDYNFAVVTGDAAGNQGALSNVAQAQTAPASVLPTLPQVVDKAVFYDSSEATGWINDANAQQIRDYFVGKGYTEVDATGLATFMKAHATSKVPSVVVSAEDIFPDTVIDVSSGAVTKKNILNDYLDNGGRIVQYGDIPFYNISQGGTRLAPNPADNGSITILGFSAAGGTWDKGDTTTITPVGKAFGMTSTWTSVRPAKPADVDVVLESAAGGAAGWIKFYPTSAGPGMFIRLVDTTPAGNLLTDAELADGQHLAEFSGTVNFSFGRLSGNVVDSSGSPVSGAIVALKAADGSVTNAGSDAAGFYSSLVAPDNYTITASAPTAYGVKGLAAAVGPVSVGDGQKASAPAATIVPEPLPQLPQIAAADKVVYYDSNYTTSWINDSNAQQIRDYFVGKGYKEVDAAGLATFMKSHASSKTPSVVVMSQDIYPDTVVDLSTGAVTAKNIVDDYLNNGGRTVNFGDIPFYNVGQSAGGNLTPGDSGSTTVLGLSAGAGARDKNDVTVITPVGQALGLTSTWNSVRPANPGDVDIVLDSAQGGAAGWIKLFPNNTGTGEFIRLVDSTPAGNQLTDAELADALKLAELSGTIPVPSTPTATLGDLNGDGKVNVQDATLALQIAVGLLTPTPTQTTAADVNKDGKVNVQDATLILQAAVGLRTL